MVHSCCICKWSAYKKPPRSFHKFPINESDKIKWLEIVGKINGHLATRPFVCSLHFKKDCFRYGAVEGRAFLKQGSLPTLHLTQESAKLSNNSSTEIRNVSSVYGINFCDSPCSSSTQTIEEGLSNEITMERFDDIIEEPSNKKMCLDKPLECGFIEWQLQEQEAEKKLIDIKKEIDDCDMHGNIDIHNDFAIEQKYQGSLHIKNENLSDTEDTAKHIESQYQEDFVIKKEYLEDDNDDNIQLPDIEFVDVNKSTDFI